MFNLARLYRIEYLSMMLLWFEHQLRSSFVGDGNDAYKFALKMSIRRPRMLKVESMVGGISSQYLSKSWIQDKVRKIVRISFFLIGDSCGL